MRVIAGASMLEFPPGGSSRSSILLLCRNQTVAEATDIGFSTFVCSHVPHLLVVRRALLQLLRQPSFFVNANFVIILRHDVEIIARSWTQSYPNVASATRFSIIGCAVEGASRTVPQAELQSSFVSRGEAVTSWGWEEGVDPRQCGSALSDGKSLEI
jgi:hypothetical protein